MNRMWALAAAGLLVACSPGSGTSEGSSGSIPSENSGGSPPDSAPPTPYAVDLSTPSTLPAEITPAGAASANGIDVVVGQTWIVPGGGGQSSALAAVRRDEGPWEVVRIDDGRGYAPPLTGSNPMYGWWATDVAAGPGGFVAVGGTAFYSGNIASGMGGLVWFSGDGSRWTRIDLRGIIPMNDAKGLQLTSVVSTSAGYVVIGRDGEKKALTFFSADGQSWTLAAQTVFAWAILPKGLFADGDRVVAWYDEFECLDETFASGTQPILSSSLDGGVTWAAVNMSALPVLSRYVPEADAAACAASGTGYGQLYDAYHGSFSAIGVAGGLFTVVDDASATIATSADTVTWVTASLPVPRPNTTSVSFYTLGNAFRVFAWDQALVVLTRSLPSTPTAPMQLIGWLSTDGGASFRSIVGADAGSATTQVVFNTQQDGRVMLILQPRDEQAHVVDPARLAEVWLAAA